MSSESNYPSRDIISSLETISGAKTLKTCFKLFIRPQIAVLAPNSHRTFSIASGRLARTRNTLLTVLQQRVAL